MKSRIILVGGFLGSGKTTLLWETAKALTKSNLKIGLITNDQASELVDTAVLEKTGVATSEISGSCFCSNFNGFKTALKKQLEDHKSEIIMAESVGSSTDLSAAIIQPLKKQFGDTFDIAPLNVLVEPKHLNHILHGTQTDLHSSAAYIIRKQLEEADHIVINKTDLVSKHQLAKLREDVISEFPKAKVYCMSTQTGEGIETWINDNLNSNASGTHIAQIDYDIYAEGEAVLGVLNATVTLQSNHPDWNSYLKHLLKSLGKRFDTGNVTVGHIKAFIDTDKYYLIGNITGKANTLQLRGKVPKRSIVKMTLNARVQMAPHELEMIFREELEKNSHDVHYYIDVLKCLQPRRPIPTYRYARIISAAEQK